MNKPWSAERIEWLARVIAGAVGPDTIPTVHPVDESDDTSPVHICRGGDPESMVATLPREVYEQLKEGPWATPEDREIFALVKSADVQS